MAAKVDVFLHIPLSLANSRVLSMRTRLFAYQPLPFLHYARGSAIQLFTIGLVYDASGLDRRRRDRARHR
jgi:hypothetical protein